MQRIRYWLGTIGLAVVLAACGGGDGGGDADPAPSGTATLGADGGRVVAESAEVVVPPGAMERATTIRIAADSTGAPPLPRWAKASGAMLQLTPHGSTFAEPVTVRLRAPDVALAANERLMIAKAQPGGAWEALTDTQLVDGQLEVKVSSFSFFTPVIVSYVPTTIGSFLPFGMSPVTFSCGGAACPTPVPLTSPAVTASSSGNGGQLPSSCVSPEVQLEFPDMNVIQRLPASPSVVLSRTLPWGSLPTLYQQDSVALRTYLRCRDPNTDAVSRLFLSGGALRVDAFRPFPTIPQVRQFPSALTIASGDSLTLRAVLTGGASARIAQRSFKEPTVTDRAVVYLERLAAGDSNWRTAAIQMQTAANPQPTNAAPWAYWGFDFAVGPVSVLDNGARYRVRACYQAPTATVTACSIGPVATLTVVQQTVLPGFAQQPVSVIVRPGETANFSARANGTPNPTLQWQTRAAGETGWGLTSGGSGSTTADFTTTAVTLADNGRQFRLLATNAAGTTASEVVTLSVSAAAVAPTITSQPTALTVVAGSEAVFAVTAQGTAALSYQWLRNGVTITGANGAQLKLPAVSGSDAATYTVRVSNSAGNVTSAGAVLNVSAVPTNTPVAPTVVTQPAAVAVNEGNVATFAVGVTGSGPMTFQWRRNGVAIPGATAAAHTIPAVSSANAGNYSVAVGNAAGSVTSQSATLAVVPATGSLVAPTISVQPAAVVTVPRATATLAVSASGSGPLSYQWFQDGSPITPGDGPTLSFDSIDAISNGSYTVTVSNAAGSVTSAPAQLLVIGAPQITAQPQAASVIDGATATFTVQASGELLRYQWARNGVAIDGAVDASFSTDPLTLADNGAVYTVIVYNGAGLRTSAGAVLTVTAAPGLQQTTLASMTHTGAVPDNTSGMPTLSSNGRRIAFSSVGTDLVAGGATVGSAYVRDLDTGTTVLVNRTLAGTASSRGVDMFMKISGNGRYVIFSSDDPNLVAGDTNGGTDVFVRDLQLGSTVRVNVTAAGAQVDPNGNGTAVDISADGRFVLFQSGSDLTGGGSALPNGYRWFVRDLQLASVVSIPEFDGFNGAVLSGDGQHAAILDVDAGLYRVRMFDQGVGVRTVLSIPTGDGFVGGRPALSNDGRYVAFAFRSTTLLGGAAASADQIGLVDTQATNPATTLELVSRTAGGLPGDGPSSAPRLSADGRHVLFLSRAPALTGGAGSGCCASAASIRDRVANTTLAASRSVAGAAVSIGADWERIALSPDAGTVAFVADIGDVQAPGTLGGSQVFVAPRP